MSQTEAFARALIDAQLKDQSWNISDGISVRYEYTLADGDRADYLLCGREGRGLAIVEAKRKSINLKTAVSRCLPHDLGEIGGFVAAQTWRWSV